LIKTRVKLVQATGQLAYNTMVHLTN